MKRTKIIGGIIITTVAAIAFAAEVQKTSVQSTKEQPQLVIVMDGKDVIAEIKVRKPGTLNLEAADTTMRMVPGGGKVYNFSGGSKLELFIQGKPVFAVSGDSMIVQNAEKESKTK